MAVLQVVDFGLAGYREVWEQQKKLQRRRIQGEIPDTLILVEHDPVYTIGNKGNPTHITGNVEFLQTMGIDVVQTDRGGDVTCHGPGQLVGYPIIDLNAHRPSISWYMDSLQEVLIQTIKTYGLAAKREINLTGVWVGNKKIAALGVRLSRWVSMHGFALNANIDLGLFDGLIPCGLKGKGITSMQSLLERPVDMQELKTVVLGQFQHQFSYQSLEYAGL